VKHVGDAPVKFVILPGHWFAVIVPVNLPVEVLYVKARAT